MFSKFYCKGWGEEVGGGEECGNLVTAFSKKEVCT